MKYYIKICKIGGIVFAVFAILALIFWLLSITNGGPIEGTGFVDMQRPVAGSGNFDVDSEENLYFPKSVDGVVQIYDKKNNYLYSIDVGKDIVNDGGRLMGSLMVRVLEEDIIEVFLVRSRITYIYNRQGFLEEINRDEKYYWKNVPISAKEQYEVEKNGVIYYARNSFYTITKEENGVETILFKTPPVQIAYLVTKGIAIGAAIFVILITFIDQYIKQKNKKKEAREE